MWRNALQFHTADTAVAHESNQSTDSEAIANGSERFRAQKQSPQFVIMNRGRPPALRRWDFHFGRLSWWEQLTPPQLFVGSFGILVVLGTLGFRFLPGLYTGVPFTWEESLFTSTSAVCVTGLNVIDPATRLTPLGQAYVLLLIQLGGLGMIVFTSLIILALGGRLSLRHESLASAVAESAKVIDSRQVVFQVIRMTLLIEGVGAMLLYLLWVPRLGWEGAWWPAIFHAVSAFCNAGFSTFSNCLMDFQQSPGTLLVIAGLIVAGGLGFLTLEEISPITFFRRQSHRHRISLQSSIVLLTTMFLILSGWAAFSVLEWNQSLKALPPVHRLTNALFLSATARTAGFNSIDYTHAADSSNFLSVLLMMIGGSPGSTAGGIKTTTFALLGLLAWSRLKGDETTSIFSRSLRKETTDRAVGLFVIAFGIVTVGILLLSVTERWNTTGGFLARMFEAVSAFNTVGLSMGFTPSLSSPGRLVVIALMFIGRVGPLSGAAALARRTNAAAKFRYSYEDVMVG